MMEVGITDNGNAEYFSLTLCANTFVMSNFEYLIYCIYQIATETRCVRMIYNTQKYITGSEAEVGM